MLKDKLNLLGRGDLLNRRDFLRLSGVAASGLVFPENTFPEDESAERSVLRAEDLRVGSYYTIQRVLANQVRDLVYLGQDRLIITPWAGQEAEFPVFSNLSEIPSLAEAVKVYVDDRPAPDPSRQRLEGITYVEYVNPRSDINRALAIAQRAVVAPNVLRFKSDPNVNATDLMEELLLQTLPAESKYAATVYRQEGKEIGLTLIPALKTWKQTTENFIQREEEKLLLKNWLLAVDRERRVTELHRGSLPGNEDFESIILKANRAGEYSQTRLSEYLSRIVNDGNTAFSVAIFTQIAKIYQGI